MKQRMMFGLAAALFVALLAACGQPAAPPTPTVAPTPATSDSSAIVKSTLEAMALLKNYQATIDMELTGEGGGNVTLKVWAKGSPVAENTAEPLRFKGEVTKSDLLPLPVGTVAVLGPVNMIYDPVQKVVLQGESGVGGSELYNLFLGSQIRAVTLLSPGIADVQVAGDEQVGGFATTRIDITPRENVAAAAMLGAESRGTIWIDKATKLPVQLSYSDSEVGLKWTASDLDITTELTDAQLAFEPPADAKVIQAGDLGDVTPFTSLDEASQTAGFTPMTPAYLPSGLPTTPSSVGVQQTPLGNMMVVNYAVQIDAADAPTFPGIDDVAAKTSRGITIQALKGVVNLPANLPTAAVVTEVSVKGQTATQAVLGANLVILSWKMDDVFYTVRGIGYGAEEVLKVAESLQ